MLAALTFTALAGGHGAKPGSVGEFHDVGLVAISLAGDFIPGGDVDGRGVLLDRVFQRSSLDWCQQGEGDKKYEDMVLHA